MSPRTLLLDERLHRWLLREGIEEHPALRALREATDRLPEAEMRSSSEQMALLALVLRLLHARRVLEVGCFTGYGALAMALALPEDGQVVTVDVNRHWAELGRRYWREAGVEARIRFVEGEALAVLDRLVAAGERFDLIYLDADKKRYPAYRERAVLLLRPGGVLAADNVFWNGEVADPAVRSRQVEALRRFVREARADPRLAAVVVVPVGDGLLLAQRVEAASSQPASSGG